MSCMCSWGKLWTTKYRKTKKDQLLLLKSREQKQGVGRKNSILRMPPAHSPTKRVGKPPKPLLQPNPWTQPYPHPI